MEWLIVIGLAIAAWHFLVRKPRKRIEAQNDVERRMVQIWRDDPDLTTTQVATLVRDELLNCRVHDPAYFAWATEETAERLLRTVLVELRREARAKSKSALRRERRAERPALPPAKEATSDDRGEDGSPPARKTERAPGVCWKCGAKNKTTRVRCRKCNTALPID